MKNLGQYDDCALHELAAYIRFFALTQSFTFINLLTLCISPKSRRLLFMSSLLFASYVQNSLPCVKKYIANRTWEKQCPRSRNDSPSMQIIKIARHILPCLCSCPSKRISYSSNVLDSCSADFTFPFQSLGRPRYTIMCNCFGTTKARVSTKTSPSVTVWVSLA